MAEKGKEFRLCYVDGNIMYFTDNFENQTGDDWDDAPYQCNAGEPYEWNGNEDNDWNSCHGHLKYIGFFGYVRHAWNCGEYSVDEVNKKAVPWLYNDEAGGLMAGSTMDEAIEWCKRSKIKWGELTE